MAFYFIAAAGVESLIQSTAAANRNKGRRGKFMFRE
jgi:hypothetical protein